MVHETMHARMGILGGSHDKSGTSCRFFQISDTWGIKVYTTEDACAWAHSSQEDACAAGLAPMTGQRIAFVAGGEGYWGYMTEVCPYVAKTVLSVLSLGERLDMRTKLDRSSEMATLCDKLSLTGYDFGDNHVGNFGWMDKPYGDELVCIDFY